MIYIFLILADFFSFFIALLTHYNLFDSWRLALACAFYLLTKAYIFRDSMLSIADGLVGLYIVLLIFGFHFWFVYFVIGLFIYKGISLIA